MRNNNLQNLQQLLGINFKNLYLLQTAFIHRSFLNEVKSNLSSNERMEFLGDAVLSFIISSYLFKIRPKDTEGDLTNLRSFIVKTDSLAKAASKLNLGEYLKLSKGEESSGGRASIQLLANTYEALLGAVYLDGGLEMAQKMVERTLLPNFRDELKIGPPKDAKSALQEITQERFKKSPYYKILKTSGPDHAKTFMVGVYINGKMMGQGQGTSKQEGEDKAAQKALKN